MPTTTPEAMKRLQGNAIGGGFNPGASVSGPWGPSAAPAPAPGPSPAQGGPAQPPSNGYGGYGGEAEYPPASAYPAEEDAAPAEPAELSDKEIAANMLMAGIGGGGASSSGAGFCASVSVVSTVHVGRDFGVRLLRSAVIMGRSLRR